jgi:FtsH-binding integral membrane protein
MRKNDVPTAPNTFCQLNQEKTMSYGWATTAAQAAPSERAAFIRRTYAHLAGAILAFIGVEALLLYVTTPNQVLSLFAVHPASWLLVLLAFWGVSALAQHWAQSDASEGTQYLGLGLYVVAEAVIFLPLLTIATKLMDDKTIVPTAGILTLAVFAGLTLSVFVTKKDFSFMAPILSVGSMIALGLIVVACFFQTFTLGMFFSFAMVALMSGYILYYTSNVMLHYPTNKHVAAALALFAAVATLFWWILRIVMILNDRR